MASTLSEAGLSTRTPDAFSAPTGERLAPVVHLTHREGLSAVFMSQVARPMSLVGRHGHPTTLAVFTPIGELLRGEPVRQWRRARTSLETDMGLALRRFPAPPSRLRRLWDEGAMFQAWLRRSYRLSPTVILHCRGTAATHIALRIAKQDPRYVVVFDCRGVDAPEFLYVNGYDSSDDAPEALRLEAEARDARQCRAAQGAHVIICVSEAMKRELTRGWSIPPRKMHVIPCSTDAAAGARANAGRAAMRRRLGLEGRFVVAYCGSLMAWQMPRESLAVFRHIAEMRSNAHFLALTTQPAAMAAAADEAGVPVERRTILSVPHSDVPGYLAAADVGLLIRKDSPVNRVASPVKFAEYLSCGVPVILTENIGDFSELVRRERLGLVLANPSDGHPTQSAIRAFLESDCEQHETRSRCSEVAISALSYGMALSKILNSYRELSG